MKTKLGAIILAVISVGLLIGLLVTQKNAVNEKRKDTDTILTMSNKWVETRGLLDEQQQVNILLTNDLSARRVELAMLTNKLTDVSTTLAKTETSLKSAQDELTQRDAKIADLEKQNAELDQKASDLSTAITNLNTQIDETQRKLAASEGDKAFLEKELSRLMAEKADLERKFNDLVVVREQVKKLKEELNIARRLEWIRKGLFAQDEKKGAQRLMELNNPPPAPASADHYDLNVEVNSDGTVRVIPPLTNQPAATPPQ